MEYTAMEFVSFNGGLKESKGEFLFKVTSDLGDTQRGDGQRAEDKALHWCGGDDVEGVTELMRRRRTEELAEVKKLNVA